MDYDKLLEKRRAYSRAYHWNNREKELARMLEYRIKNRELLASKSREHYWENRDEELDRQWLYREINRDKIRAKKQEPILCIYCGSHFRRNHKAIHERSIKHQLNYEYAQQLMNE